MTRADDLVENYLCFPGDRLLEGIGPGDKRHLWKLKKPVSLEPDKYLVRSGDRPDKIFVHRRGGIETIPSWRVTNAEGSRSAQMESVYGLTEAFSSMGFDYSIKSVTAAEFDVIEKKDLFDFICQRPELIQKLLTHFGTQYSRALNVLKAQ